MGVHLAILPSAEIFTACLDITYSSHMVVEMHEYAVSGDGAREEADVDAGSADFSSVTFAVDEDVTPPLTFFEGTGNITFSHTISASLADENDADDGDWFSTIIGGRFDETVIYTFTPGSPPSPIPVVGGGLPTAPPGGYTSKIVIATNETLTVTSSADLGSV